MQGHRADVQHQPEDFSLTYKHTFLSHDDQGHSGWATTHTLRGCNAHPLIPNVCAYYLSGYKLYSAMLRQHFLTRLPCLPPVVLLLQVKSLKDGKSVQKPIYNHVSGLLDPAETVTSPNVSAWVL